MPEERDFRGAAERVMGPDFILETSLWLPLERLAWKRWEAGAQGEVGVCAKEGPVRGKWKGRWVVCAHTGAHRACSGFRKEGEF